MCLVCACGQVGGGAQEGKGLGWSRVLQGNDVLMVLIVATSGPTRSMHVFKPMSQYPT